MRNRVLIFGAFLIASFLAGSQASAWHGYPPYGAWVYGSGPSYVARTRTVYRARPAFPLGWGRVYSTRVSYGIHYRPYIRPYYVFPRYTYYYTPVRVVRPVLPVIVAPTCVTPTYAVGYSIAANAAKQPASVSYLAAQNGYSSTNSPIAHKLQRGLIAADTSVSSKLVATNTSIAQKAIPSELLNAADAILEAGGFTAASKAYAELSVRYGSSHVLMGRRFVAQMAAGNLVQAETISELARLHAPAVQFSLDAPLSQFVGQPVIELRNEQLAKRAFENATDSTTLRSLSHWLYLQGDLERAELFNQRASQIDGQPATQTPARPNIAKPIRPGNLDALLLTAR